MIRKLFRVTLTLWVGGLWSLSWVTWTLFHAQNDRHLAGILAGPLFSIETYVGLGAVVLALLQPVRRRFAWGFAAAAALALNEWALRPVMVLARTAGSAAHLSFGAWHGVSALLYVIACGALIVLVWNEDLG